MNETTLDTERLILRPLQDGDEVALMPVFGDPDVMEFGDLASNQTEVATWVHDKVEQAAASGHTVMLVTDRETGDALGYCGLFDEEDIDGKPEVEVGYRLAKAAWGNGFATEAVKKVLEHAHQQLGLDRVVAMIDPGNTASANVATKVGMAPEKEIMMPGYDHPDVLYVSRVSDKEKDKAAELSLYGIATNPELVTMNFETGDHENLVMRPLLAEDATKLAAFLDNLSEETRRLVDFKGNIKGISGKMIEAINKYDKQRLVIENSDHRIVGLMELSFGLPEDDIKRYAGYGIRLDEATDCRFGPTLADDYQGSGLGSKILPAITDIAQRFSKTRMILWGGVLANNDRAIHFYEKFGFVNVGSFNDGRDDLVDMMLDL